MAIVIRPLALRRMIQNQSNLVGFYLILFQVIFEDALSRNRFRQIPDVVQIH
jgi:hypothetical protein